MVLYEVIACGDEAETSLFSYITLQTQHRDMGLPSGKLFEGGKKQRIFTLDLTDLARPTVACEQEAETVASLFACEFGRIVGINNGARMNGAERRLKDIYSFEEERALLC